MFPVGTVAYILGNNEAIIQGVGSIAGNFMINSDGGLVILDAELAIPDGGSHGQTIQCVSLIGSFVGINVVSNGECIIFCMYVNVHHSSCSLCRSTYNPRGTNSAR